MTSSQTLFKKPTDSIVIFPQTGKLTGFVRKFHLSLLREAQKQIIQAESSGQLLASNHLFEQKLSILTEPFGDASDLTKDARSALLDMQKTIVSLQRPDEQEDQERVELWRNIPLIGENSCVKHKGNLYLQWYLPDTIFEALKDPKTKFTLISPEELACLKTYTSVALYEIVARYQDIQQTCTREKEWWVKALSGTGTPQKILKKQSTQPKLRDWVRFKNEKVKPAIEEINSKTKFKIELIEEKEAGVIKTVQFKVIKKDQKLLYEPTKAHIAAAELGVPAQNITNLLAAGHSVDQASLFVAKVKSRQNDQTKEPIRNLVSYLSAIVREEAGSVKVLPVPDKVKRPTEKVSHTEKKESLIVEEVTAFSLLRDHVIFVSEEIEASYLNKVRAYFIDNGMLTPSTTRALNNKNWRTGIIFHKVVDIYGTEKFGTNWKEFSAAEIEFRINNLKN